MYSKRDMIIKLVNTKVKEYSEEQSFVGIVSKITQYCYALQFHYIVNTTSIRKKVQNDVFRVVLSWCIHQ